tara:strand:- start:674 stop:1420 length:747 start_codon:yes stop_codon:yes gene_type:complete
MTSVESLQGSSAQVQQSRTQLNQDFDDFLSLLTTQLQNQDPLEPMDTNEFTNQLVQFSQVEQQLRSNDILDDMRALDVLQITQLGLGFVGMDVVLAGDEFNYSGSGDVELGYTLPETSRDTNITIKNADGDVVYTVDGESSAGIKTFKWDGKNNDGYTVPEGDYTIEVSAQNTEGTSLNVQTNVPGYVEGIESDGAGNILLIIGDDKLPISDITRVKLPNEDTSTTTQDTEGQDTGSEDDTGTEDTGT